MSLPIIFSKKMSLDPIVTDQFLSNRKPISSFLTKTVFEILQSSESFPEAKNTLIEHIATIKLPYLKTFDSEQILNKEAIFFLYLFKKTYHLEITNLPPILHLTDSLKKSLMRDFRKNYPTTLLERDYLDNFLPFINNNIFLIRILLNTSCTKDLNTLINKAFETNLRLNKQSLINLCIVFSTLLEDIDTNIDTEGLINALSRIKELHIIKQINDLNSYLFHFLIKNFEKLDLVELVIKEFEKTTPTAMDVGIYKAQLQYNIQKFSSLYKNVKKTLKEIPCEKISSKELIKYYLMQDIRLKNVSENAIKVLIALILTSNNEKNTIQPIKYIEFELTSKRVLLHPLISKHNTSLLTHAQLIHVETLAMHMILQAKQDPQTYIQSILHLPILTSDIFLKKTILASILELEGFFKSGNLVLTTVQKLIKYLNPNDLILSEELAKSLSLFFSYACKKLPLFDSEEMFWNEMITKKMDCNDNEDFFLKIIKLIQKEFIESSIDESLSFVKTHCYLEYQRIIQCSQFINNCFFSNELSLTLELLIEYIQNDLIDYKSTMEWVKPHLKLCNNEDLFHNLSQLVPIIKERIQEIKQVYKSFDSNELAFQTDIWLESSDLILAFYRPLIKVDDLLFSEDVVDFSSFFYKAWWLSRKVTKSPYVLALEYAANYVWHYKNKPKCSSEILLSKVKAITDIHYPSLPYDENIAKSCFFRLKKRLIDENISKALQLSIKPLNPISLLATVCQYIEQRESLSPQEVLTIQRQLEMIRHSHFVDTIKNIWEEKRLDLTFSEIINRALQQFSLSYKTQEEDLEEAVKLLNKIRKSIIDFLAKKIRRNYASSISNEEIAHIVLETLQEHIKTQDSDLEYIHSFILGYELKLNEK